MGILKQVGIAVNSYGRALSLLPRKGIRRYLLYPLLINLVLLVILIWFGFHFGGTINAWLLAQIPGWENIEWQWLQLLLQLMMQVLLLLLYFIFYKYLVLIVLSPLLAFLSEKVDAIESGREFPFCWNQLWHDIGRALLINLRNFLFEIMATVALGLLGFIPIVGLIAPLAVILVQSYFFGFALMDYNAERHRLNRATTESWMRRHYAGVSAVGLVFHLLFIIPFIGWVIAPVLGTVAASLAYLEMERVEEKSVTSF